VADATARLALSLNAEDQGKDVLQTDDGHVYKVMVDTGVNEAASWSDITAGSGGVTSDGTTAQDAVLLTERADHVNTPVATTAEIWLSNDTAQELRFTNDGGTDYNIAFHPTASVVNQVAIIAATGTARLGSYSAFKYVAAGGYLEMGSSLSYLKMKEHSSAPTGIAGYGEYWVRNDAPTIAMFTDDTDVDHRLSPSVGNTVAPGAGDDGASGHPVGSIWIDETADDAYISLDSTTSTAVWKKITP
jgi:hypothetical protein